MKQIKVIFIGGLTNGLIVYNYLKNNKYVDLLLTLTYKDKSKKSRHTKFPNNKNIIKSDSIKGYENDIISLKPDLIFVAGWSELINDKILKLPKMGVIGFHPSKLPFDKGRSVLAWQLSEGYKSTALSMFYYNNIPDGGDIIAQEAIKIYENDYINDILDKVDKATNSLMKSYFPLIRTHNNPRVKQNLNDGNFRRLRTSKDSLIDWNTNSIEIYNLIRAISKPYPCAIAEIDNKKYKIIKAQIIKSFPLGNNQKIGKKIALLFDNSMIIKTKDSYIRITDYEKQ